MKKIGKILSVILVLTLTLGIIPTTLASAASYPSIYYSHYESTPSIIEGGSGKLVFTVFPEYKNEKYHVEIYNEDGTKVGSASSSYYNTSIMYRTVTINVDAGDLDLEVGEYTIKYWLDFYTFSSWHSIPNTYTASLTIVPDTCNGNHSFELDWVGRQADCETEGINRVSCTVCGYSANQNIGLGDHDWGEWCENDDATHVHVCSVCEEEETKNHNWTSKITQMPTFTQTGIATYTCSNCAATKQGSVAKLKNGWNDVGGKKVYCENGVMLRKQWINYQGVWYYVDGYGYRVTDSWVEKDGNKRYVTAQGWLATNRWINYKGTWYYVDKNGDRVRETWVNGANGKCWLTAEGYMAANRWINYKGTWYYVGSNGARVTETWVDGANGKCWLTKEGYMATNKWINYKGTWYYVKANGARATETWIDGANGKCWLTKEGYMAVNRWINYKGTWYYVGANGARVTNKWVQGQHGICYLSKQGYMVAGCWLTIDGKAYQFAANGVCLNK